MNICIVQKQIEERTILGADSGSFVNPKDSANGIDKSCILWTYTSTAAMGGGVVD